MEDTHLVNRELLTQNRVYARVGSSQLLEASPPVVHFGGFDRGKAYSTTLRVRNISTVTTRLHIIPPTSVFFKVVNLALCVCACKLCLMVCRSGGVVNSPRD